MTEVPFFWNELRREIAQRAHLRGAFLERVPEVPLSHDKQVVLEGLEPFHRSAVEKMGFSWSQLWRAEQVHGVEVAEVPRGTADGACDGQVVLGVDALITNQVGVLLGIYVADCGAVYFFDRQTGAIGLAHSGKKGTQGNIVKKVVRSMERAFGTRAEDLSIGLGPCIRKCHYEVDFSKEIGAQARALGVGHFEDCGLCTADHLERFYSYRLEKGKTGRMLALLGRESAGRSS